MHSRKKALKQVSLDETSGHDSTLVRPEHGIRDDRLNESVDRIVLVRSIQDLPPGYRTIFLLHEVEGYDDGENARILDFSVGNFKSHLHKSQAPHPGVPEPVRSRRTFSRRSIIPPGPFPKSYSISTYRFRVRS
jgi:hypothetical protein